MKWDSGFAAKSVGGWWAGGEVVAGPGEGEDRGEDAIGGDHLASQRSRVRAPAGGGKCHKRTEVLGESCSSTAPPAPA